MQCILIILTFLPEKFNCICLLKDIILYVSLFQIAFKNILSSDQLNYVAERV